ncbi:MAG: ATP-binding cassette domain-containing protein, partial [Pseudomonadales bacterium]|nr:ATP-binding cassette domain-containing protein [Pseudomonadales bacterium]
MLRLRNLALRRGTRLLIDDANLVVNIGDHVGLTGANGCGKSSLFSMILGELEPDAGELKVATGISIAHVSQETPAVDRAIIDYVIDGDVEFRSVELQLENAEKTDNAMTLAELHDRMANIDGYAINSRAARLLDGLGFSQQQHQKAVNELSGGWRMRLNLARALISRSDLLLLDEPTNHLDLDAVIWLETWLKNYAGTLLLISHDRDFLDKVINRVLHIENRSVDPYTGNYSDFEVQRASKLALQDASFQKQQKQIQHIQDYVRRFGAKATKAKQAQSRIKALERMELIAPAHVDSPFHFSFPAAEKIPERLLTLDQVDVGYPPPSSETQPVPILKGVELSILAGQQIGLLGRNGAGKSTLIKLIAGKLGALGGTVTPAKDLKVGYFAQHQLEQLDDSKSPIEHLIALDKRAREQDLRNFIGGFGFIGDRASEPVGPFSGGEKARLALALIAYQRPNLLLMDEPTNHLDLEMRHALVMALQDFKGAMIIVSHDRHMLRSTTDSLLLVDNGIAEPFDGDLDEYQNWLSEVAKAGGPNASSDDGSGDPSSNCLLYTSDAADE